MPLPSQSPGRGRHRMLPDAEPNTRSGPSSGRRRRCPILSDPHHVCSPPVVSGKRFVDAHQPPALLGHSIGSPANRELFDSFRCHGNPPYPSPPSAFPASPQDRGANSQSRLLTDARTQIGDYREASAPEYREAHEGMVKASNSRSKSDCAAPDQPVDRHPLAQVLAGGAACSSKPNSRTEPMPRPVGCL